MATRLSKFNLMARQLFTLEQSHLLIFEHEPKFDAAFIKIEDNKILIDKEVDL